ncbi:acyltransferase family protein [Clostridium beijerinckii]|uniref:acyltransferase family protein n=1 Tax=Clostridium beijerinckii TaxID=1520 RepID=UPI00047BA003|nr:acyltransferase [Clostridium beijerinckii]
MINLLVLMVAFLVLSVIFIDRKSNIESNKIFMSKKHTTVLKGVAMVLVLVSHIGGYGYNIAVTHPLGAIGVCIFLIVSGYGLNESIKRKGRKCYFKNRIKRVMIPYWIVILISYITLSFSKDTILNLIQYMFLLKLPEGSYWYIEFILCWYVFFYFISLIKNRNKKALVMIVVAIIFSLLNLSDRVYVWQIVSFPIGVIISDYADTIYKMSLKAKKATIFIPLIVLVISVIIKKMPFVENNELGFTDTLCQITLSLSAGIFIVIIMYILYDLKVWKITSYIGEISYELYLVHPLLLSIIIKNSSAIFLSIFIISTILLSVSLNKICKLILKSNRNWLNYYLDLFH